MFALLQFLTCDAHAGCCDTARLNWLQALILYTTVVNMCTTCFNTLYFGISLTEYICVFQFQN